MLHEQPEIKAGLDHFLQNDDRFRALLPDGHIKFRGNLTPGLSGLCRIVIGQQISAKVANTLWARFQGMCDPSDPEDVLSLSDGTMRSCGLSFQKMKYVRGAAQSILEGLVNPDNWHALPQDAVYQQIVALKGFGPWSAQIYLLFYLGKGDVWPAGDLGIQIGLQHYAELNNRPDERKTEKLGSRFAPYRSAAALLLWDIKDRGI